MTSLEHPPLRAGDIDVSFGSFRLFIPQLIVPSGLTLLVGPNGAGKTTLLRVLAGESLRGSGTLQLRGVPARHFGHLLSTEVQFVRDSLQTVEGMSVNQLLKLAAAAHGSRWNAERAESLAERFHITRDRQLRHLSRGNAAKLGLVLAEAASPSVLLLDEPTSGLDPFARAAFLALLAEIVHECPSRSIVFSTHLLDDAAIDAPASMIVLGEGRILRELVPEDVRSLHQQSQLEQREVMASWFPDGMIERVR